MRLEIATLLGAARFFCAAFSPPPYPPPASPNSFPHPPPFPPEDPFTGSATGCMAAYLFSQGWIGRRFIAEQGHGLGRPGRAEVEVLGPPDDIEAVKVGGAGVVAMWGEAEI